MYCLINYDTMEVLGISEDKSLLIELMYDYFLEDAYVDFCDKVNYSNISGDEIISAANDSWDDTMYWNQSFMRINLGMIIK